MLHFSEGGRKDKTDYSSKLEFQTYVINFFWLT